MQAIEPLCASRLMIINRGCDVSPQIDFGDTFADDATPLTSIKPLTDMR